MQRDVKTRATVLAFIAYFLWGFSFLFSRLGLNTAQPFVMLAHRFSVATLVMLVLAAAGVIRLRFRGKKLGLLLLMGFFEPILYFVGETYGILYTTTAFSGVMIATIPIFTLGASAVFLKENATRGQVLWSVVSIAGVMIIALLGTGEGTVTGAGVAFLLLAVGGAVGFTILSRKLAGSFSAVERTFVSQLEGMAAFWLLGAIQCRGDLSALIAPLQSGQYWICIGYLGCIASVACYVCLNYAFSYLSVNSISIGTNLVTVISVAAGVIFLHERFSWLSVLACAVILAGIYGVQRCTPSAVSEEEASSHG